MLDGEDLPDDGPDALPEVETDEVILRKGEEEIKVHKTAINYYLSAGWKAVS